ncbi:MAG: hypothetical protein LBQ68_07235 [Clostridiales bacterium]|jgi:ribosomal protein L21E|nr:hypothetical protein [Clostridiales bacterium]
MAKKGLNKYDAQHLKNIERYAKQIDRIYQDAAREAAAIGATLHDFNPDKPFSFDDYPQTKARIEKLLKSLKNDMQVAIVNGVEAEWTLSNNKNSELAQWVFGDNIGKLTKEQERRYFNNNDNAREAFLKRKTAGLNLSDRVWKYTNQFKGEIEMGLDLGIRTGLSAQEMARDLKQYLQYPDKLFRRVRDEHGQLRLSEAARNFHPGTGVYRSSYKNAMRLARTETNMAYRTADHERWQQLDFVVGIEVRLSNNHTLNGVPFTDICDDLKGKYPKEFKFTGWHPQCRCHVISVLKTPEEVEADTEKILNGEELDGESVNKVTTVPEGFNKWVQKNEERIAKAKSLPYFLQDNSTHMGNKVELTKQAAAGIKESASQSLSVKEIKPISVPHTDFALYKEFSNGGRIEIMDSYEKKSDHKDLITIARDLAEQGKIVQITTNPHFKDVAYKQVFGALKGTIYDWKCPDLIIDGVFYEYESFEPPFTKKKISKMISHGAKQSERIIINNNKGCTDRFIINNIRRRLHDKSFAKYTIKEVWVYEKGKVRKIW